MHPKTRRWLALWAAARDDPACLAWSLSAAGLHPAVLARRLGLPLWRVCRLGLVIITPAALRAPDDETIDRLAREAELPHAALRPLLALCASGNLPPGGTTPSAEHRRRWLTALARALSTLPR